MLRQDDIHAVIVVSPTDLHCEIVTACAQHGKHILCEKPMALTEAQVKEMFGRAGAPTEPEQIGLTRADVRKMTDFVQLMRWRINILDLAKRACIYDELLDKVFGKGGVWEI